MPVELHEALEQINEIRGHLATAETFRGYRAASVAGTGIVALLTAAAQPTMVAHADANPVRWVALWVAAAMLCGLGAGAQILYGYLRCRSPHRRATTRIVIGHLLPVITAGGVLTWTLMARDPALASALPGIWAILVALGMFASRRHLPRIVGWCALYYLAAGAAILHFLPGPEAMQPWVMGVTFGTGQLASALVLYWNLERHAWEEENI